MAHVPYDSLDRTSRPGGSAWPGGGAPSLAGPMPSLFSASCRAASVASPDGWLSPLLKVEKRVSGS